MFSFMRCRKQRHRRFKFAVAQQTVIDENTSLAIADRLMHQRRGDSGINTARQSGNNRALFLLPLARIRFDLFFNNCLRRPIAAAITNRKQKIAQQGCAQAACAQLPDETARQIFRGSYLQLR